MVPYPDPGPDFSLTPWVEHVYTSLRWTEDTVRRLHGLLEHETVNDDLRGKIASVIAWLDQARQAAYHAAEKMGVPTTDEASTREHVSMIARETQVRVLDLTAAWIEEVMKNPAANRSVEDLRNHVGYVVRELKIQSMNISNAIKGAMKGPRP